MTQNDPGEPTDDAAVRFQREVAWLATENARLVREVTRLYAVDDEATSTISRLAAENARLTADLAYQTQQAGYHFDESCRLRSSHAALYELHQEALEREKRLRAALERLTEERDEARAQTERFRGDVDFVTLGFNTVTAERNRLRAALEEMTEIACDLDAGLATQALAGRKLDVEAVAAALAGTMETDRDRLAAEVARLQAQMDEAVAHWGAEVARLRAALEQIRRRDHPGNTWEHCDCAEQIARAALEGSEVTR